MADMVKVHCNGHGWVWAETKEKIHFTQSKDNAKEYELYSTELMLLEMRIEDVLQCNHDIVRIPKGE